MLSSLKSQPKIFHKAHFSRQLAFKPKPLCHQWPPNSSQTTQNLLYSNEGSTNHIAEIWILWIFSLFLAQFSHQTPQQRRSQQKGLSKENNETDIFSSTNQSVKRFQRTYYDRTLTPDNKNTDLSEISPEASIYRTIKIQLSINATAIVNRLK